MQLNGLWQVFLAGSFGASIAELLKWYGLRESENLPTYAKSFFYWMVTGGMVLAGGVLATLYGTSNVNAILAVNIGVSAPLTIAAFSKAAPVRHEQMRGAPGSRNTGPELIDFLAGR
jgi:drug/metabolite transporter (DMT)-like permease